METIYSRYLKNSCIPIYIDGSKTLKKAEVGVYTDLLAFYVSLSPFRTNSNGKFEAIRVLKE